MTQEQRATLEAWKRAKTSPQRTVLRASICLLAAEGLSNNAIAAHLSTSRPTVIQWRKRFEESGPMGLAEDAPHGPSPQALPPDRVKVIVEATLHATPRDATQWSVRSMAKAQGVGKSTVQRIWDAHGLQPHRVETFKLSKDKRFVEKLTAQWHHVFVCSFGRVGRKSHWLLLSEASQHRVSEVPATDRRYRALGIGHPHDLGQLWHA